MNLHVNGEPLRFDGATLGELLVLLQAPPDGVAVAVNGEVVPRSERVQRALKDGDRVEVIRAVGGG
jgi:sulfur carrier protein